MVITLLPISQTSLESFRGIRLRALQDTPLAFGSTYARESQYSDDDWRRRLAQWNGERSTALLAWDGDEPCGIVAGFFAPGETSSANLVSMWVAPTHRRSGIGRMLVSAVIDWARASGARDVNLMVTSCNDAARRFYEHIGFRVTGRTEPYPNDPALLEHEMIFVLA